MAGTSVSAAGDGDLAVRGQVTVQVTVLLTLKVLSFCVYHGVHPHFPNGRAMIFEFENGLIANVVSVPGVTDGTVLAVARAGQLAHEEHPALGAYEAWRLLVEVMQR